MCKSAPAANQIFTFRYSSAAINENREIPHSPLLRTSPYFKVPPIITPNDSTETLELFITEEQNREDNDCQHSGSSENSFNNASFLRDTVLDENSNVIRLTEQNSHFQQPTVVPTVIGDTVQPLPLNSMYIIPQNAILQVLQRNASVKNRRTGRNRKVQIVLKPRDFNLSESTRTSGYDGDDEFIVDDELQRELDSVSTDDDSDPLNDVSSTSSDSNNYYVLFPK